MTGFARRSRRSASSRSSSSSYSALRPGMRRATYCGMGFGSQRPPPEALQMLLARLSG